MLLPCLCSYLLHIGFHPGVAIKIKLDVRLCFGPVDPQLAGQPKGRHAVDESKIDGFCATSLIPVDIFQRNAEYF
ncbi:MAG: hypothetical protein Ct9H300mP14_03200 [Gammaproteobacteria bacterium]|nr:MAG: hypothetical protein Ct9H300mP14_03200 [Gammaproteobacteria bacterium]